MEISVLPKRNLNLREEIEKISIKKASTLSGVREDVLKKYVVHKKEISIDDYYKVKNLFLPI